MIVKSYVHSSTIVAVTSTVDALFQPFFLILSVHCPDTESSINGKYISQVGVVGVVVVSVVPRQISSGIFCKTSIPLLSTVKSLHPTSASVLRLPVSLLVISHKVILVIPLVVLAICSGIHWIEREPLNLLEPLTSNVALEEVVLTPTLLPTVSTYKVVLVPDQTVRFPLESVFPLISSSLLG